MINVCLLGCGGSLPTPDRFLTSMLIEVRGKKLLVDCGEGTQVSMKMVGWGFKGIEGILLTHVHADHILGLPGLLLTIANSGRTEPLKIIGPKGTAAVVSSLMVLCAYLPYEVYLYEWGNGDIIEFDFGSKLIVSALEVEHTTEVLAYSFYLKRNKKFDKGKALANNVPMKLWNRLQKGEDVFYEGVHYMPDLTLGDERKGIKLSYCTDSRPVKELVHFIKESDLFICEGMYGSDDNIEKAKENKHMIFSEAAALAKEGDVKELWLTHFSPAMKSPYEHIDSAAKIFSNIVIGQDRMAKLLKFED